ncbi:hypothetical protein CDL15_Pgr003047 [Punica granatum]|uniref:Uncharacterized protein n=1 Tax=Punica granatum TaxID=22663 RepID=A0A218X2E1_PUNGR|nr:hypothetical protein CDL15_Pgr003047 [Punica granatum]PKI31933.1 hypothetical protein CRG98_047651 [Punica granatum]
MSESSPTQVEPPPVLSAPESDPVETSPVPATDKPADEDSRVTKRRRNCPESLDKFQEYSESYRDQQSFTFDTSAAPTPEFTPKFGSFKLPAAPEQEPGPGEEQKVQVSSDSEEATAESRQEEEEAAAANGITGN